jgi:hypothetical protein
MNQLSYSGVKPYPMLMKNGYRMSHRYPLVVHPARAKMALAERMIPMLGSPVGYRPFTLLLSEETAVFFQHAAGAAWTKWNGKSADQRRKIRTAQLRFAPAFGPSKCARDAQNNQRLANKIQAPNEVIDPEIFG